MYDEFAERTTWGPGTAVQKWFIRRVLHTVLKVIDRPITDLEVLEIGTGMGHFAEVAVETGVKRYVGVEPNRVLREAAQQSAGRFEVLDAALPNLPESINDSFDFVILTHVLEHATSGYEAREWADALLKTVKPGGAVVVISPDVLDYKGFMWATDWSHAFPTSAENVRQIFADTGATVKVAKRMRFGSLNPFVTSPAFLISKIFPTRLANVVSRNLMGRELGTSVQVAFFWGLACVIAIKKPISEGN
jgi:2-polyprenyl-3-methyl-5-hydroxy-6-metoxy-1,4-benzoquinol methylase